MSVRLRCRRAASKVALVPYDNQSYWSNLHELHPSALSAVGYPALGVAFNRVAYQRRLEAAQHILGREGGRVERVLEAAVGVGAYEPLWRALGSRRWTGIDISERAIAELRARFPSDEFHVVDITSPAAQWPLTAADRFDLVSAIDVLYHITDDAAFAAALANLAGFTSDGGRLLVSDVFAHVPTMPAAHVRRRPMAQYEKILTSLGLRLSAREPVFAILGDPIRRPGFHLRDEALYWTWRVLQKAIRAAPEPAREPLGLGLATCLRPIDAWLCRAGWTRDVNLELATFTRAG